MLDALASGSVSSEELVLDCLARTAAVNPTLNAIVVECADNALDQARAVDSARARGQALGPLAGLPFTAKLDYDVAGQATSQGSVLLKDLVTTTDSPMIARMRAAGAVLIGRTNEPDFGVACHTHSSLYGLTRNPWDLSRSTGGSSGGEAAALASGMSPLGLGSDFGGSIRGPAGLNGVAGFKAGWGRYPDSAGQLPEPSIAKQLFAARGPLARSVQDLVWADSVLRGMHIADPRTVPTMAAPRDRGRVGLICSPTDTAVPAGILSAVQAAGDALRHAGYEVRETHLAGWPELVDNYADIALAEFGGDSAIWESFPDDIRHFVETVHAHQQTREGAGLGAALARRHRLAVEFSAFHEQFDLLLMPTWCAPPHHATALQSREGIEGALTASRHLCIFNLLGLPALSLPAGAADGLPVGVQVSALRHHDASVLTAGLAIESLLGTPSPVSPRSAAMNVGART
jgi:amidase